MQVGRLNKPIQVVHGADLRFDINLWVGTTSTADDLTGCTANGRLGSLTLTTANGRLIITLPNTVRVSVDKADLQRIKNGDSFALNVVRADGYDQPLLVGTVAVTEGV